LSTVRILSFCQDFQTLGSNADVLIVVQLHQNHPATLASPNEDDADEVDSSSDSSTLTVPSLDSRSNLDDLDATPNSESRTKVEAGITRLNAISRSIRRSGAKQRNARADVWIDIDGDGNNLTAFFTSLAVVVIDSRFPNATFETRQKLARSIAQRRNRIAYQRKRQEKLSRGRAPRVGLLPALLVPERKNTKPLPSLTSASKPLQSNSATATSVTSATKPDADLVRLPTRSVGSSTVISGASFKARTLVLPKAPDVTDKEETLCPYCCLIYPAKDFLGERWR
jgi:hypothetical protein